MKTIEIFVLEVLKKIIVNDIELIFISLRFDFFIFLFFKAERPGEGEKNKMPVCEI